MRRQVAVELARLRGRRAVLLASATGLLVTAALAVGAARDVLGAGTVGPSDVAAAGGARALTLFLLLAALAVAVGAATAGGDWSTGSVRVQLLTDPRRTRLWLAKCAAVTLGTLTATVLLLTGFWAGVLGTAAARGVLLPAGPAADLAVLSARGLALVTLAALGAVALTLAVRYATAAMVLVLAVTLVGDALLGLLPVDHPGQWGLRANVAAWLHDGTRLGVPPHCPAPCDAGHLVSLAHGAAVLGGLLLVTLAFSWLVFRRRDVP